MWLSGGNHVTSLTGDLDKQIVHLLVVHRLGHFADRSSRCRELEAVLESTELGDADVGVGG